MKHLFILLIAATSLMSCSSSVDLAIDNPSDNTITVKVDSLVVEVPAKEVVWVEMGKGEHEVTLDDNSKTKFDFQDSMYMLNPTGNEYLVYEQFYGDEAAQTTAEVAIPSAKVKFMGLELEGNYKVVKDLINKIEWEIGAREDLPETIEVEEGDNYTTVTKLYDSSEFLKMMMGAMQSEEPAPAEEKPKQ